MPHVVTQSCCSDGSCVYACPVNCIHPSPDEPGFATAEMLYIDPAACVDCGACVSACPVGAIAPDSRLPTDQLPFVALNAAFYPERPAGTRLPPTSNLAPVIPAPTLDRPDGVRVAIVGSGPAAMYAADELLTQRGVRVNVFERLPTPYGLVRAGVAPDHQKTKRVTDLFDHIAAHRDFRFHLNVDVGTALRHADLAAHHHAVLYAVGAPNDRRLDVPGATLPGVATATEVVAWYNGHPDVADMPVDLSGERVVIIGNGNVALDVARVLTSDPDALRATDVSDTALAVLRTSAVREVVVVARRGPEHSAFTLPELLGLIATHEVVLSAADHDRVVRALPDATDPLVRGRLEVLADLPLADGPGSVSGHEGLRPRIRLAYGLTPLAVLGDTAVTGVRFGHTSAEAPATTDAAIDLDAGLVLTSIGYRGRAVADLPFDERASVVPNDGGRVIDPTTGEPMTGTYVAGWIKRGPTGFIGTNKSCARETVESLVADLNAGRLPAPSGRAGDFDALVRARCPQVIDGPGWREIDAAERRRGRESADGGRPRVKFTRVADMVAVAATAPRPRAARRFLAAVRGDR